jgi:hypothetical protein
MSLELEDEIMAAIGLGNHYNWFNGSGSCFGIRNAAIRRLPIAIRAAQKRGAKIARPPKELIKMLYEVSRRESSDSSLTKTWQALSDAIRTCMTIAETKAAVPKNCLDNWAECHLPYRCQRPKSTVPENYFSFGVDG